MLANLSPSSSSTVTLPEFVTQVKMLKRPFSPQKINVVRGVLQFAEKLRAGLWMSNPAPPKALRPPIGARLYPLPSYIASLGLLPCIALPAKCSGN